MSEPPDIFDVDFSHAHFLDHSVWRCHGEPGGVPRHLKYRWIFQWRPGLYRLTTCKLHWHRPVTCWRMRTAFVVCEYCWARLDRG